MRAGTDVHNLILGDAECLVGMLEDLPGRLVGLRLLSRDNAVDVTAKLRHVTGDDCVVGIGDDAELKALRASIPQGAGNLGEGRHSGNAIRQDFDISIAIG